MARGVDYLAVQIGTGGSGPRLTFQNWLNMVRTGIVNRFSAIRLWFVESYELAVRIMSFPQFFEFQIQNGKL
ncbi:hypothetical protein OROGR_027112 [Orobanche gracilis]